MKVLIIILINICVRQLLAERCEDFKTCGACMGFAKDFCVWCSADPKLNITRRCQSASYIEKKGNENWCNGFVYNTGTKIFSNITKEPFRSAKGAISAVQFQPKHMTIKMRPGQKYEFPMSFKHADDFPLDVYYLMDYSYTMNKLVNTLRIQSQKIKDQLTVFTNNVWFGLGSFIEKPDYPFVGPERQSYAFRNNLNLTSDLKLFDQVLSENRNFSNYDDPEAGLDALMQVMACEKIGWRPNAKRIIVLCTDATYHSAGDGKAVLAYKPNDMKCHLNSTNYYDKSLVQDYPSVSQINKMASDGKFKIIFATIRNTKQVYDKLALQIAGAEVALLTNNNIFQIIKKVYLASIRYVRIQYRFPQFVKLTLKPDCSVPDAKECQVGHKKEFPMKAVLSVNSCPADISATHQRLEVRPVDGGIEDKLNIDLEIANCECPCETYKNNNISSMCSNAGTLQCGICVCNKGRYGEFCECDGSTSGKIDLDKCKNVNDTDYCSGKGTCGCGKCSCKQGFSGKFCEFDDNSCKKKENKMCAGHGECFHAACVCESADWSGDDCGCSTRKDNCYAPYSKEICSGKGQCVCNECICGKLEGKEETYSGVFCEDCEDCAEKRCKDLEDYVRCNFKSNKTYCDEMYNQTSNTEVQMLNKTEINARRFPTTAKWCRAKLDDKTSIVFIHVYDKFDKTLRLIIQKEADKDPEANIWVPVGIAIGTVVLIGLLTVLLWKLIVDAMDEKEYTKFMNEAKDQGYDVTNPIYQPASVNFQNPTFEQRNK